MDENNNYEEKTTVIKEDCPICDRHPILKSILCGLLIFLGAYCAFYTVSDWHFKRMAFQPFMPMRINPKIERQMMNDMHKMDKAFKRERNPFARHESSNIIHISRDTDEYKIMIDLRAIDNNAENVQVSANGNILTISGRSIKRSNHNEQIAEFQQNYMFGDNVKLSDIKKEVEDNYYVITVPVVSD